MIGRIEVFIKRIQRIFSRTHWTIFLLRLERIKEPTIEPGLVMTQIDGLSLTQFNRALQQQRIPFLSHLLRQERYVLHTFYSGLPSNTPAVQGELFYGVKGCVPSFHFIDRRLDQAVKMFDAPYVETFELGLEKQDKGLLAGGSAYSDIFTGGAKESHFCWAHLGWGAILHATNPLVFPFLIILYIDIFVRTFILLVIEFFLALFECIRGTLKGRVFLRELELVWLRVLICVFLREVIVTSACMDIMRGVPIIHLNFLGYDEQAHCRGPASRFAHWSLRGIDDAIQRIDNVIKQSAYRDYDLWIYGDHGQEKTTPYLIQYGRTAEEAIEKLFGTEMTPHLKSLKSQDSRARLLYEKTKVSTKDSTSKNFEKREVIVTAMGPLGQIYVKKKLEKEQIDFYAQKLVLELKIPLVLTREGLQKVKAWTPMGTFILPEQMAKVFGEDHPFLEEMKEDLIRVCYHPDAGEFIIAGWCKGEPAISFPLEYGAHASMGPEETKAFALLPMDAPLKPQNKTYLRPLDLRQAAQRFLNKEIFFTTYGEELSKLLRLMSYNVHGCMGMDGTISAERIARVIARHKPDVIALQELDVGRIRSKKMDQVGRIAKCLEMKYHFHPAFSKKEEQYGNAILSRFPMALIKMGALPQLSDHEPRGAMWISMEVHGVKTQIINTHLSVWPQERVLQIDALLSKEWLGHHDCLGPVILCGDLNALPGSTVYRKICQKLIDSQAILVGHRPHRTWFGQYPLGRIDYIFVSSEFQVGSIHVPRTRLDKVASDHLPLIADLKLKKEDFLSNPYESKTNLPMG